MRAAGGQLLDSELLVDFCHYNPLPSFRHVYAQLAALCDGLGRAVSTVGQQQVRQLPPVTYTRSIGCHSKGL